MVAASHLETTACSSRALIDDIVVATRNRPDDLRRLLDSIAEQSRLPCGVIVVDASDGDETRTLVAKWTNTLREDVDVRHLKAGPGSSSQRNIGVAASSGDVVHFVDDDVTLASDYLDVIMRRFETQDDLAGVGGLVYSHEERGPRLWWRMALLDSARPGRVLPSGMNVATLKIDRPVYVDWLSGCAMSYRSELAARVLFDESLAGYALMEDADFAYRARKFGLLLVDPAAGYVHHVSSINRWSDERRHRMAVVRRGWFVEKNLPNTYLILFWWSTFAAFFLFLFRGVATRRMADLARARWQVLGACDYLRGMR